MASAGSREVGRISVRVVPDTDGFRRALQRQLEAITKGIEAKVNVDPELNGFRQKVNAATKGMRTEVAVVPDVKTFRGQVKSMLSSVGDSLSNIKAPSFGSGINGTGYVLIAAAIAALSPLVAGLLGALTTSLLALPGLITAAVVPIGALVLGLDGLKKAASVLKQPFDDLRATMSAKVQEQFTPVFEKLKDVFPTLKAALPAVTQGLADMAKSFADVLTNPENLAKLDQTIRNIASGLSAAAPGIRDFTQGFLDLIKGFSEKLPDIGKWFSETGASFTKWVSEFTAKGPGGVSKFDVAIGNLGDTLKIIGGGLVELAGKALDFFSDPEKVKSFKAELDGLINTVLTLSDAINGIATVMSKIPGFGDGKGDKLLDFAPVQVQWIADMLPQIRQSVANVITEIIGMFAQVPAQLGSAWSSIAIIAQGVWNSVAQAVSGAMTSVVSTIVSSGGQIMAEVGSWPSKIAGFFANAGSLLIAAGRAMMDGLLQGIRAGAQAVFDFVSGIAGKIASLKGPLPYDRKVLIPNGQALMEGLGTGLENGFADVEHQVSGMADRLKKQFEATDWFGEGKKLMDVGLDFGAANGKQLMSDLGIGGGAITAALGEGMQFGKQALGNLLGGNIYNFHTSNVDDTIALRNNQLNRQRLGYINR
ncbi:phage tail protein [Mycobacteroides chelonae]|uniref:phage tail protein n=1 Tax=Mycobacteroides chelonae TaxID=1774 RepID=UPI001E3A9F11|nr:cation transporter [Mycobacteroides chelonae]